MSGAGDLKRYAINYVRAKGSGPMVDDDGEQCLITGCLEVNALSDYIAAFPSTERVRRFFRKLTHNNNGSIYASKAPIGKNTLAAYPKLIALYLKYSEEQAE